MTGDSPDEASATRPGFLERWRPAGASRAIGLLFGATAVAQLIGIAVAPLLTRLYRPDDFGVYAAGIAMISVIAVVGCLRYEQAIPIAPDNRQAAAIVVACATIGLVSVIVLGAFLLLFGDLVARLIGRPPPAGFAILIVLGAFGGLAYLVLSQWAVRSHAFGDLARTRLSQGIGLLGSQLGLGLARFGSTGLLLGDAIGRGGGSLYLARRLWQEESSALRSVRWPALRRMVLRYRRFPVLSGPSALLDVVNLQIPAMLMLVVFGPTAAGLYLLAGRIGSLPNGLLASSIAPVFIAAAAERHQDGAALRNLMNRTTRRLFLVGLLPAFGLALLAPLLFPIVFGEEWRAAGTFAAFLAPMFLAQLVSSPISGILSILERPDIHLAKEVLGLVGFGLLALLVTSGQLTPEQTVAGISLVGTAAGVAYVLGMHYAVSRVPMPRARADAAPARGGLAARATKRGFDLVVSLIALVVATPVILVISAGILITMGRPIFFRQERAGRGGAPFTLLKFRTLDFQGARCCEQPLACRGLQVEGGLRAGRFARFLRSSGLDELPQLLNVVAGQMSLVGPRPLLMRYLPRYTAEQATRHDVRPGITGWAQINGRTAASWPERLALDAWYARHRSMRLDLAIMWRTLTGTARGEAATSAAAADGPEFLGVELRSDRCPVTLGPVGGPVTRGARAER
jgi:lipopolysaccharide/colanic/teichoic acid biosynthesis glycosyltransferase